MEMSIKDLDLLFQMVANRNECRKRIHVDNIGTNILFHVVNLNLLELRLRHWFFSCLLESSRNNRTHINTKDQQIFKMGTTKI